MINPRDPKTFEFWITSITISASIIILAMYYYKTLSFESAVLAFLFSSMLSQYLISAFNLRLAIDGIHYLKRKLAGGISSELPEELLQALTNGDTKLHIVKREDNFDSIIDDIINDTLKSDSKDKEGEG